MRPEVDDLFHRVADLPAEERARYYADNPRDADVQREVEELLAHDRTTWDPLMPSIVGAATRAVRALDAVGARCGPFRLASVIGRGGMGVVYLAERIDGEIRQQAAIKLLHPGLTDLHRERFLREREILAALSHPNVAHLLDAGHLDDGQPYLVMEYVSGKPIDRYCEGLAEPQRIELFLKVCTAVDYLHRNHLVHRDLKPSNILVTSEGEPKLLDFGISKILDLPGDATETCQRMLTPNYASPEQVSGAPVGTASDIYSLGIVLQELFGGVLKGDLEVVIRTATRPEPEHRYASVGQFGEDLRAVFASKPIRARKRDWIYRTRKLTARRPFALLLGACAAALTLTAGAALWPRSKAVSKTTLNAKRLTASTAELPIHSAAISTDGKWIAYSDGQGVHVRDTATGAARLLPKTAGHVVTNWMPDGSSVLAVLQDGPTLKSMAVPLSGSTPVPASGPWVYSRSGKRRAMSAPDGQRVIAENADGTNSREVWRAATNRRMVDFAWSPNEEEIAVISSGRAASTLEAIDVIRGRKSVLIADEDKILNDGATLIGGVVWGSQGRVVFSTLERTGATAYNSNLWEARLNDRGQLAETGLRKLTDWTEFPIQPGSLTTDGRRLVFIRNFSQRDVYVASIDAARRQMGTPRRLTLDLGDDYPTGWTRDGKSVILTSDRTGELKIFRQDLDRQVPEPLVDTPGRQLLPRLAPDGQSVLFCSIVPKPRACRLMRSPLSGGRPELVETISQIADFRCSPAGPCAIAELRGESPGHVVWELDLARGKGREIYRESDALSGTPDLSPDGKSLATVSGTRIIVRSFSTGAIVREIQVRGVTQLSTLDYAPDGKGFYTGEGLPTEARQLYVDLAGNATILWRQPGKAMTWSIPSPDGRNLALLMHTTDANVYMLDTF